MAALGATALAITPVWANPVVGTWTYDITSSFDTSATVITGSCARTNTTTTIAWGCPSPAGGPQSSLVLDPSSATGDTVQTWTGGGEPPSGFVSDPGIVLTHNNFVIKLDSTLQSAALKNTITFTDPAGAGGPLSLDFGINFIETPNTRPCTVSSDTPCPDILVVDNHGLDQSFNFDGNEYFLSLFPASGGSLNALTDAECAAAGAASGCFGFTTEEGKVNSLHFGVAITSTPILNNVPEPGALGMMGLGLLGLAGLGVLSRRRSTEDTRD